MKMKKNNIITLEQFKDKHYGDGELQNVMNLRQDMKTSKLVALIYEARIEKGMTQEELAAKVGTTKSYISKIENNVKEVRLSTLHKIVELGLGGQLLLSIKL